MRPEVHQAALKAAAKVAFSVVLLQGCGGAVAAPEGARTERDDEGRAATNEQRATGKLGEEPGGSHAQHPGEDAGATTSPAPASCKATLAAAFPEPAEYKWEPEGHSKDVVACCDAELAEKGPGSPYRWDCCVAHDADVHPNDVLASVLQVKHRSACTPWGPPVPPAMAREQRARPEIAAWLRMVMA